MEGRVDKEQLWKVIVGIIPMSDSQAGFYSVHDHNLPVNTQIRMVLSIRCFICGRSINDISSVISQADFITINLSNFNRAL